MAGLAQAHEVVPTIADVQSSDGQVTLDLRVNLEALMSGIDLDAVADTNDAENASDYDSLRALPADEVAARAPELLAQWNKLPVLRADGQPAVLETVSITHSRRCEPMSLPRVAAMVELHGTWCPPTTNGHRGILASDGSGALVVRQQGVEEPLYRLSGRRERKAPRSLLGWRWPANCMAGVCTTYIPCRASTISCSQGPGPYLVRFGTVLSSRAHIRPLTVAGVGVSPLPTPSRWRLVRMGWVAVPASHCRAADRRIDCICRSREYLSLPGLSRGGVLW